MSWNVTLSKVFFSSFAQLWNLPQFPQSLQNVTLFNRYWIMLKRWILHVYANKYLLKIKPVYLTYIICLRKTCYANKAMPPYIFCIIYLWESCVDEKSHGHAILLPVSKHRVESMKSRSAQ